jgi:hypothetical protein
MSDFHIDYKMVQAVLLKVKSVDSSLVFNDELVRELTYMVDRVRREAIDNYMDDHDDRLDRDRD